MRRSKAWNCGSSVVRRSGQGACLPPVQFLQLLALQLYGYDHFGDARVVVEAGVSEAPGRDGAASRER